MSMRKMCQFVARCPSLRPLRRKDVAIAVTVFLLVPAIQNIACAEIDDPSKPKAFSREQTEKALAEVYRRVTPATIRFALRDDPHGSFTTGIVVSPDGYVLHRAIQAGKALIYEFTDGRRASGKTLGWSDEWRVGLSKIEKDGPWPCVELAASVGANVGQCVVSVQYPFNDSPQPVRGPLLLVDWVKSAAPGLWFRLSDAKVANAGHWNDCSFVCDLQGRLAGAVARLSQGSGVTLTDASVIRSLWDELVAGKNIDQLRLDNAPVAQASETKAAPLVTEISNDVRKKCIAASVHIRSAADVRAGKSGWSGTIVSVDGLVATCAHHDEMPGSQVVVCLADGRDLAGKVVGLNPACDIGLVQITESTGPLPHVPMGDSKKLRPGDRCLFAGYGPVPKMLRQSLIRTSTVVPSPDGAWSHLVHCDPETKFVGGDSGGGLFISDGQLVAIHTGIGSSSGSRSRPHTNPRVELFREHGEELRAQFHQTDDSPFKQTREELESLCRSARGSVVQILDGEKQVAMGTLVGRNGQLLTKASVLPDRFKCRLADGRLLAGTLIRTLREHDVAVVRVDAADLAPIEWSTSDDPPVGSAVGLVAPDATPVLSFVSHAPFAFPAEPGHLRAKLLGTDDGLQVEKLWELPSGSIFIAIPPSTLLPGDILLSIEGQPISNLEAYLKIVNVKSGDHVAVSGDAVRLVVRRGEEKIELREVLAPPTSPRLAGQTPRSTGFPRVLSVNTNATTEICGGPVIDRTGKATGIVIAWRNNGWLFVLPADILKSIVSNLE